VSLTSDLTSGGPVSRYFNVRLPHHRRVVEASVAGWPLSPVVELARGEYSSSELGLAAGHLLAGLVAGRLGWGSGGSDVAMSTNPVLLPELDALLEGTLPDIETAARASWWAGLHDRLGRGFSEMPDPSLDAFLAAQCIEEALSNVPRKAVDDLVRLAEVNAAVIEDLRRFGGAAQTGLPPRGAAWVGGADADIVVAGNIVEIKTVVGRRPSQIAVRQLTAYALLDADNEWSTTHLWFWWARYGAVHSWAADELVTCLAGFPTTMDVHRAELREVLEQGREPDDFASQQRLFDL
jgi:hypothetical protein